MAAFDQPFNGGGRGGLFPYADALINWGHPLANNLVFFAVPASYGYFDLVRRLPMPHQPVTNSLGFGVPSCIQLFPDTPLKMGAWAYGNGNTNPFGAYARTPGSWPGYNSTSMTIAASIWCYPYAGGYAGGTNRWMTGTNSTDTVNSGILSIYAANDATALVGGNGSSTTVVTDLTNINNIQTTHCILASYNGTDLFTQRDNGIANFASATAEAPLANIDHFLIGDSSINSCGRPIFWAAAWNTAMATTAATALTNLVTCPDGNASRNPAFGAVPRGLLLPRASRIRSLA